jgi:hypothetical protein
MHVNVNSNVIVIVLSIRDDGHDASNVLLFSTLTLFQN